MSGQTSILALAFVLASLIFLLPDLQPVQAQITTGIATTTLTTSICGNSLVDGDEQCDVPSETGTYSTTIVGRQCRVDCRFGPYCGDGILQTIYSEQCDDGNNTSGDFCSATCTIEPAGSGGSSGGGSSSSGGSSTDLGDTEVNVKGKTIPRATIHILLDSYEVGTANSDSDGEFEFTTAASPGTVSMGFWVTDSQGVKSITYNTTFDATQGAITNVNGLIIPPTLALSSTQINPGDTVTLSGETVPNAKVEVQIGSALRVQNTTSDAAGKWSIVYNTSQLSAASYAVKARVILGDSGVTSQSTYSTVVALNVGVDGKVSGPSDLNVDGSVNLVDFSILIFWWQTNGGNSNPPADINGNGKVGLEDFSILLFNWTG